MEQKVPDVGRSADGGVRRLSRFFFSVADDAEN